MDGRSHRRLDADPLPFYRLTGLTRLTVPLLILLLGAALRVPSLAGAVRLSADEALYATFARRVALHGDVLLSGVQLDKPPLLFYVVGGSFALFGVTEFAARLPNVAASLLTLAAVYALSRRIYDERTALLTMLLLAMSPFDRSFAATVFTDPLLTLFVMLACLMAVSSRWRITGTLLALAFASKPSALQWIPLVIIVGIAVQGSWCGVRRAILPFGAGIAALTAWSIGRATVPDFWTLNAFNNTPGRFIRANEMLPRLMRWWSYLSAVVPLPVIGWLAVPIQRLMLPRNSASTAWQAGEQSLLIDLILTTYLIASLAALWLIAFNTYDRYLHTLVPFTLILTGRVLLPICTGLLKRYGLAAALVAACLMPFLAYHSTTEPDRNAGIDQIAATLNALPAGSIIYDYWLGWELGFYLGDNPHVQIIWEPSIDDLVTAIRQQSGYFVGPRRALEDWLGTLQEMGISVTNLEEQPNFLIVQVSRGPDHAYGRHNYTLQEVTCGEQSKIFGPCHSSFVDRISTRLAADFCYL